MAAAGTDIVSLNEIKTELRLGGDTDGSRAAYTERDDLLTAQIDAAVSFVSKSISSPLVDVTETLHIPPQQGVLALWFPARHVKSLGDPIRYWSPSGALRDEPDGTIAVSDLGRRFQRTEHMYEIWPPADGWPETLGNSLLQIQLKRGLDLDDTTQALKQAVILCVRQLFDGYREIRPTEAFYALITPWRRYD